MSIKSTKMETIKIEITEQEREILHNALICYIQDVVKATNKLYELGAVIENPPTMKIKALHFKIISAT